MFVFVCLFFKIKHTVSPLQVAKSMAGVVKSMDDALRSRNLEKVSCHRRHHILSNSEHNVILKHIFLQITALMDKSEHQFDQNIEGFVCLFVFCFKK